MAVKVNGGSDLGKPRPSPASSPALVSTAAESAVAPSRLGQTLHRTKAHPLHPRDDHLRDPHAPGDLEFYLLRYPAEGCTLVLLGHGRDDSHYAGALGRGGRVIHSVKLADGKVTLRLPTGRDYTLALRDLAVASQARAEQLADQTKK